jgi:hypothetical protein
MLNEDVEYLYGMVQLNARVTMIRTALTPGIANGNVVAAKPLAPL